MKTDFAICESSDHFVQASRRADTLSLCLPPGSRHHHHHRHTVQSLGGTIWGLVQRPGILIYVYDMESVIIVNTWPRGALVIIRYMWRTSASFDKSLWSQREIEKFVTGWVMDFWVRSSFQSHFENILGWYFGQRES